MDIAAFVFSSLSVYHNKVDSNASYQKKPRDTSLVSANSNFGNFF